MPSKKIFTSQNAKHAADSFFSSIPTENIPEPPRASEPKAATLSPVRSTASMPTRNITPGSSPAPENKTTISITFGQKRKLDSQINVRVNAEERAKFAKIAKSKGYNSNEMINLLMSEFIKANE